MQTKEPDKDTDLYDDEFKEELAGILTAISIVSKRLAKKLCALQKRCEPTEEGGDEDGK